MTPWVFAALYVAMIPFYFATWEEYYLDEMILPVINGPTEGILTAMLMGKSEYSSHQNIAFLT